MIAIVQRTDDVHLVVVADIATAIAVHINDVISIVDPESGKKIIIIMIFITKLILLIDNEEKRHYG